MNYINSSVNQHFISQVEQKLNSLNPGAERGKRRIYSFAVVDREYFKVKIDNVSGVKIEYNLSSNNLFTYFIDDNGLKHNLENAFNEYETNILHYTNALLNKIENGDKNITDELLNILLYKFMNLIRNPYCIKKTLNTFGSYIGKYPLEPSLQTEFKLITSTNKTSLTSLATGFDVSEEDFINWIKILFLMLMRTSNSDCNIIEQIVKTLLENENNMKLFQLDNYVAECSDKKVCLSDRSWVQLSDDTDGQLVMQFNLTSNVLMTFALVNIEDYIKTTISDAIPEEVMIMTKRSLNRISCRYVQNDLDYLADYNKRATYQAKEHIFCASDFICGVSCV